MSNFTDISRNYQRTAVLQKSAAERLFEMLAIGKSDDVLDLGCGSGYHTHMIRMLTDGMVTGIDPAHGMIDQARAAYASERISFRVGAAENLDSDSEFAAIFCNSAFQWFRDPARAVSNCCKALCPGGRMAIQAPATTAYCPNFIRAAEALLGDVQTRNAFQHFRSPWVFFDTAEEYAAVFERAGFSVASSAIVEVTQQCTPEKAFEMFESGAAAGYLNPDCYDTKLAPNFIETARATIAPISSRRQQRMAKWNWCSPVSMCWPGNREDGAICGHAMHLGWGGRGNG